MGGYALQCKKLDLLIITVCGAGIYVCLETLKYLKEQNLEADSSIKYSGVLFLFAILSSFLSQIFNYQNNVLDYRWCECSLDNLEKPTKKLEAEKEKLKTKIKKLSDRTDLCNYIATFLMFLALCVLVAYFVFIF